MFRKCAKSVKFIDVLVLAIDCSGPCCAVCLWQDSVVLSRIQENMERGQDSRLMPMIVALLEQTHLDFSDLDKIAVVRGPGSFTGLRVGLAAAKGIGLAAGKPVIGIDRFSMYRAIHADTPNLLVVIDSKRAELFCKFYPYGQAAHEATLMTSQDIELFIKSHPPTQIVGDKITPEDDTIKICAELVASTREGDATLSSQPFYLREPDVSFASAKSR